MKNKAKSPMRKSGRWLPGLFVLALLLLLPGFSSMNAAQAKTPLLPLPPTIPVPDAQQQLLTISGRVSDTQGRPLPGVSIVQKGSFNGTISAADGSFTLDELPSGATLSFSFVGYKTQEISIKAPTQLDVILHEEVTSLGEVTINTGYYTVKDRERTGSIARVQARELENQPVSNVLSSVQGRMAGVSITQGSGVPGSGYTIQIRGSNSLRREGNYPMYIIDGVPVSADTPSAVSGTILPYGEVNPLNAIHPNDIESIEILKDADATAIYGSRGANGVILVTTKKGKAGSRAAFSINSSYGISRVANKMEMMNTPQYLDMRRQAYANDGISTYPANAYDINGTWDEKRYTDWQEELIGQTATNASLQVSMQGGSENTRFLISGSRNVQSSVFGKDFRYLSNKLSGNLSHRSYDQRFRLNASTLLSAQSNNIILSDITSQALLMVPNAPALYNNDGSLNWEDNTFNNPVAAYESTYNNESKTFNGNLNLAYELLPSFFLQFNGGLNYQAFDEIGLSPNTMYNPAYGITPDNSSAYKNTHQRFSFLLEPQLNYRFSSEKHQADVLLGATIQQKQAGALELFSYGFESNALITNLEAASNIMVFNDQSTEYHYAAAFGRINYQYQKRYIVNLTGRRDGSSRFGPQKRFASFGAVGLAWRFSEEQFMAGLPWFTYGKLRASYGLSGSDLIGDYQYLDTYTVSSSGYGGSISLYPSRLHNPYFSWEKTTKLEVALESGFLNDRILLNVAWYRNRSGNQLVGIPLPATTGFSSIQANLPATVENRGLELELNTTPVKTGKFRWNSNINISFPKNKLIAFPGLEGSSYANKYLVGYSTSLIKVYNFEGIDPQSGIYVFTDYNNDGNISSPEDNQVVEELNMKYFGGWSNQLSYKHWEFSFLFQLVNQRQKNFNSMLSRPGSMNNLPAALLDVWSESNPGGQYMPYTSGASVEKNKAFNYFKNSTAAVGDASFVRLKNIQLAYQLPLNRGLHDVRLYIQGQNLITFTNYFGPDPEFTLTGYLPPLRTWSFGVLLNF